ncbi:MAG: TetR/AcrR family transcriptional regulator [Clostridiaceae bacterium]|jgi:AcrR family transcriptional regulator|nr:TetR/AcrR family transcriptional regulator [Clostridiaceae bacterium]
MIKDKRSLRTRELLTQELISLLLTKPLSEITVTELTEATDLNRATFYLHYANIYDLFQSIEDDLIEQVERWIKQSFPKGASVYYLETDVEGNPIMPILTEMFNFIYNNRDVTTVLLRNPESRLLERIYGKGRDSILNFALPQDNTINNDRDRYALDYIVSGCIGVIQSWIDNDLDLDPKTMSKITCDLLLQNRSELAKQKSPDSR